MEQKNSTITIWPCLIHCSKLAQDTIAHDWTRTRTHTRSANITSVWQDKLPNTQHVYKLYKSFINWLLSYIFGKMWWLNCLNKLFFIIAHVYVITVLLISVLANIITSFKQLQDKRNWIVCKCKHLNQMVFSLIATNTYIIIYPFQI